MNLLKFKKKHQVGSLEVLVVPVRLLVVLVFLVLLFPFLVFV